MPLINESINFVAMVRYCMKKVIEIVNHLNSGQVTIRTDEQPVYALGTQVRWMDPERYSNVV